MKLKYVFQSQGGGQGRDKASASLATRVSPGGAPSRGPKQCGCQREKRERESEREGVRVLRDREREGGRWAMGAYHNVSQGPLST